MSNKTLTLEEFKKMFVMFGGALDTVAIRTLPNGREYGYTLGAFIEKAWNAAQAPLLVQLAEKDEAIVLRDKLMLDCSKALKINSEQNTIILENSNKLIAQSNEVLEENADLKLKQQSLIKTVANDNEIILDLKLKLDEVEKDNSGLAWDNEQVAKLYVQEKTLKEKVEKKYGRLFLNCSVGRLCPECLEYEEDIHKLNEMCLNCMDKILSNDALFNEKGDLK